jgi:hypothetical protein
VSFLLLSSEGMRASSRSASESSSAATGICPPKHQRPEGGAGHILKFSPLLSHPATVIPHRMLRASLTHGLITRMRRFRKLQALVLLAALVGGVALFAVFARSRPVVYPDGLSLQWIGAAVGTNTLEYGNPLEKLLHKAKLIPRQGLRFAGITLRQPQILWPKDQDADLTGWISVRRPAPFPYTSGYYWDGSRLVAANNSGRAIENAPLRPWRWTSNELIMCVPLKAFPRDEKILRVLIRPPPDTESLKMTNRAWAEFEFANPLRRAPDHWTPTILPATNQIGDLSVTLLSLSTADNSQVHLRLSPATGWQIVEGRITDEEGNTFSHYSTRSDRGEGWIGFQYALESNRVWKVAIKLVQALNFPFTSDERLPRNKLLKVSIKVDGPESRVVDSFGTTYFVSAERNELSVRREVGLDRPYLILVEATDEGRPLKVEGGSWWEGSRFIQMKQRWTFPNSATNITLHFYSPRIVSTEFIAKAGGPIEPSAQ